MTTKTTAPNTQPTTTGFTASTSQDGERISSQLAFLTRVLKMPTIAMRFPPECGGIHNED